MGLRKRTIGMAADEHVSVREYLLGGFEISLNTYIGIQVPLTLGTGAFFLLRHYLNEYCEKKSLCVCSKISVSIDCSSMCILGSKEKFSFHPGHKNKIKSNGMIELLYTR